jgi:hypothetical protein
MPRKEKTIVKEATMTKGSHLTVWTYPDGSTKLEWDDEALLSDVRNAILKAENTIPAKTARKTKLKTKEIK